MIQSKNVTDQRLIDLIRAHYAQQDGIKIGFQTFTLSDDEQGENMSKNYETIDQRTNYSGKLDLSQVNSKSQSQLIELEEYSTYSNQTVITG